MKLTKRECRKIPLKERHYKVKFDSKKEKKVKLKYWCELDTYKDIQIVRFFQVDREQNCIEVQRSFIRGNEMLHMSYGCFFSYYSYRYNTCSTNFDFRNMRRIRIYPDYIKKIKVLPELEKYYSCKIKDVDTLDFIHTMLDSNFVNNNKAESLAKVNYELFLMVYSLSYNNFQFKERIEDYLRTFQLITKWNYKVNRKDSQLYLDHLQLVKELALDLHSPKYIAPKNLKQAHEELVKRKEKLKNKITKEMEQEYKSRIIGKYKLNKFPVETNEKKIRIIPLLSVHQVRDEALSQSNCLFTNRYWEQADNLLFTSYKGNEHLETIQYSLKKNKVVQCYAAHNHIGNYHDQVIELTNKMVNQYLRGLNG